MNPLARVIHPCYYPSAHWYDWFQCSSFVDALAPLLCPWSTQFSLHLLIDFPELAGEKCFTPLAISAKASIFSPLTGLLILLQNQSPILTCWMVPRLSVYSHILILIMLYLTGIGRYSGDPPVQRAMIRVEKGSTCALHYRPYIHANTCREALQAQAD